MKENCLNIGYFYSKNLNLYGDNGNVEILLKRCFDRNIPTSLVNIDVETNINDISIKDLLSKINLIFMGGGPDSAQKEIYEDLINNKGAFLNEYIYKGGVGLYICGAYQLLGNYYKSSDGSVLKGLGILDFYTQSFIDFPRCIGNTVGILSEDLLKDGTFVNNNPLNLNTLVGFENHGGRTYLGSSLSPLAKITKGYGNNGEDKTEGVLYKNTIGTYFHGPLLSKNPHIADFLISKALGVEKLSKLDDTLVNLAHTASRNL